MAQNYENFVRVWQTAGSVSDAAKQLDMTNAVASRTAFYLRKKGVPLKVYKLRSSKDNLKSLTELAASLV